MDYSKNVRMTPRCLHCGDSISNGRTDKKFCCEDCRISHYNERSRQSRSFRRRVLSQLSANYEILDRLILSGVGSVNLTDLTAMGFFPRVMTSFQKTGKHFEYRCFDIKYIMTSTRIYSISKIENVSVNLRHGQTKISRSI